MTTNTHDELASVNEPLATPARVMTVGAHPDDAEFGAGATLARWVSEGAELTMVIVTDGSKGSWNPDEDQPALIERRKQEQRAAAASLGAHAVVHLDHVDGELEATSALRRSVAIEIRKAKPNVVLSHDPWQRYQLHPDHRAAGSAAVDGVVAAREPLALKDSGLDAHRPDAILLWSPDAPDHAEPVSQKWFDRKVEALLCHSSQGKTTMGSAPDGAEALEQFTKKLRHWHTANGLPLGIGPAEVFKRLTP